MQDATDAPPYFQRIMERIQALGLIESQVSMQAFNHGSGIKNLRKGTKSPGIENFIKLAPILKTSPAYLAFGSGEDLSIAPTRNKLVLLPIIGEVSPGVWFEADLHTSAPIVENTTQCASPRWSSGYQYAVINRGHSLNRTVQDGSILSCVDTRAIHYQAQDGDLIIVERRDAGKIERTAKRFRRNGDACELWPDSTDPRFARPLVFKPKEWEESESTVETVGLVYAWTAPIQPAQPWKKD